MHFVVLTIILLSYTVEPPNNGHILRPDILSFVERLSSFRVSSIGGFTVWHFKYESVTSYAHCVIIGAPTRLNYVQWTLLVVIKVTIQSESLYSGTCL